MNIPDQKGAWNKLYGSQQRPWRGTIANKISFPFEKGDVIADIGCGNGKTSSALIEAGYNVIGIDVSDVAAEACVKLYGDRMRVICASSDSIPLDDGELGGAVLIHLLEHLNDNELKRTAEELIRVLRPGAKIFVRVFHRDDMRSGKGERIDERTVLRGNGIAYRYFTENELTDVFSAFSVITMERIAETTKFEGTRSRIEAVFEKY